MSLKRILQSILLLATLLALLPCVAAADRPGWNEPGREPGYDGEGLLRVNLDYFDLAAATGGDFYFWAPGEFAAAAGLLDVPHAAEPVALAYGREDGPFTQTLDVPVDLTLSQLDIFAGAQRLDALHVVRPDGRTIDANPAGVSVQEFRHMRIVTLVDPEPGPWRVELRGGGAYQLAVRARSERGRLRELDVRGIELLDFDVVELRGRPGHQGYFPVEGPPAAGAEHSCLATLSGVFDTPDVALVSETGEVLREVRLEASAEVAADELLGRCTIPDRPFRVRVRGRGPDGWPFQRVTSGVIAPVDAP